jgi:gamma-glutamyltranspeptidase/glutathione hydrolase
VVSVNEYASRIGLDQLAAGGNAVDAAVAVAFALAVTHPSAGNLGGGGFALVRLPTGETYALDFREASPAALERGRFTAMVRRGGEGPDSVGIPGSVAGLVALSERFGARAFAELIEPARAMAAEGHRVTKREARAIAVSWSKLIKSPEGKRFWGTRAASPLSEGATLRLKELSETLAAIRDRGKSGFYEGSVADSIRRALGENPQLSLDDLRNYQAIWRRPLSLEYRGLTVTTMPPPSAGGVALMSSLTLLAQYDPAHYPRNSTARAHLLLEIMRRAQADRLYSVADPDCLTESERQSHLSRWFDPNRWANRAPILSNRASANGTIAIEAKGQKESDQTTHLAVVDRSGMAVSLTTTLSSGFGSKVVTDSGIVLNNSLGSFSGMGENQPASSRRTTSSMAPTLIEDASGLRLVLGTPGGDSIPSTLLQLINLLVDYGLPLDQAVDAPRIHQSIFPPGLARSESERPVALSIRGQLERMGHHFAPPTNIMGHANSIGIVDKIPYGYIDPREGGLALGLASTSP